MSYHFLCKRGIRPARTEQFLVFFDSVSRSIYRIYMFGNKTIRVMYNNHNVVSPCLADNSDDGVYFNTDLSAKFANNIVATPDFNVDATCN